MPRILYHLEAVAGGIYTYARHQIAALLEQGAEVRVLCREGTCPAAFAGAHLLPRLQAAGEGLGPRRPVAYIRDARRSMQVLRAAAAEGVDLVLLDCLREYFAPFWIGPLRRLRADGFRIGVINHDPRRDFRIGPEFWHRACLHAVYGSVTDIFLHGEVPMTAWGPRFGNAVHPIPHGPLTMGQEGPGREATRRRYGFSADDYVILAFGQIRDGKQLDKLIRALSRVSRCVKLLVAGRVESASQRSAAYYRELIRFSGLAERVVWDYRYIPENEVGPIFRCSDAVATLYASNFVSSSGVMSCAVAQGRPLLASGGDGPLKAAVTRYPIGEWVPTFDIEAMSAAIRRLLEGGARYSFEAYLREHSWKKNAESILAQLGDTRRIPHTG